MNIRDVLGRLSMPDLWEVDSTVVREWYTHYYEPFNETKFISLITK